MNSWQNSKWVNKQLYNAFNEHCYWCSCNEYEFMLANHFISIFEAGDKFEDAGIELTAHDDITELVLGANPFNPKALPASCKMYDFYRNYAWKAIGGTTCDMGGKIFRLGKFFSWLQFLNQQETSHEGDPFCNNELLEAIHHCGINTFEAPLNMLFFLPENDEIIILPKSQRIIKLNGVTVDEILSLPHKSLLEWGNKATEALLDVSKLIDEERDNNCDHE